MKFIGQTYYSTLKRQSMGLETMIYNGMAKLAVSSKAVYFRMFWPKEAIYEFCGTI